MKELRLGLEPLLLQHMDIKIVYCNHIQKSPIPKGVHLVDPGTQDLAPSANTYIVGGDQDWYTVCPGESTAFCNAEGM